jgi:hypothetical protein
MGGLVFGILLTLMASLWVFANSLYDIVIALREIRNTLEDMAKERD